MRQLAAVRRASRRRGRLRLVLAAGLLLVVAVLALNVAGGSARTFQLPSHATLAGMSVRQRIVAIAQSQVGYATNPADSYCNKFSAYWHAGSETCPNGDRAEEWCADFAAWAWRKAGVRFVYGYAPGELNAGAASFYEWAVAHGSWHPAASGYRPFPGDVAVYGLSLSPQPSAVHVAIVTAQPSPQRGPNVINGDGNRTGFSVVETGSNQRQADTGGRHAHAVLAGYVSPG